MNARRPAYFALGFPGFFPIAVSFLLAMLMLLPIGSGAANIVMPNLVMIAVFYWMSSRPLLMPYGACAILGIFLDLWLDVPLGINILMLVLTRAFVLNQLKHYKGRSRLVQWAVFGVMSLVLYAAAWLAMSLVNAAMWPVQPIAMQWLITALSYAPVAWILGRMRRLVLQ